MTLSRDAIIFGMGYLNGPKQRLSFGGKGAEMKITDRARAALNELITEGYATSFEPQMPVPEREYYIGTLIEPPLVKLAIDADLNPFAMMDADNYLTFIGVDDLDETVNSGDLGKR